MHNWLIGSFMHSFLYFTRKKVSFSGVVGKKIVSLQPKEKSRVRFLNSNSAHIE